MDDEVSIAFIKFMEKELPDKTIFHAAGLATMFPKNYENAKREAYGFIEGWNTALKWASNNGFNRTREVKDLSTIEFNDGMDD